MNLFFFMMVLSSSLAIMGMMYKKKFLLSIILCMESMLISLMFYNMFLDLKLKSKGLPLSLLILALSAMEASIGVSLLTLISRNFSLSSMFFLNKLKK